TRALDRLGDMRNRKGLMTTRSKTIIVAALVGTVLAPKARAVLTTNRWVPGVAKWEAVANWTAGFPSTNDSVNLISTAGVNVATIDFATTTNVPSSLTISNLVLGPVGTSNILVMASAGTNTPLRVIDELRINSNGVVIISNSVLHV